MTPPEGFLSRLVALLTQAGVPFMVTGSTASAVYGQPRATNDVNVVIDPTRERLEAFLRLMGPSFYVSREAAFEALAERGMFNVIDLKTSWKGDLILRKERPFSREEFARRRPATLLGCTLHVVSPEDSLLSKLEWARAGGSPQQVRDAVAIAQHTALDREYLARQAAELGVAAFMEDVLRQARPA